METQKKHIEIHIKMDENEQIAPNSKISNVSGDDVIACYLAATVSTMHSRYWEQCSKGFPWFLYTSMKSWKKRRTNPCCNPNLTA